MTDARLAALNALLQAYPRTEIGAGTLDLYRSMLSDIPERVLLAGIAECIATSTWFPSIAEVRTACRRMAPPEDEIPTAAEAWEEIRGQLGDSRRGPEFSSPLGAEALRRTNSWLALNLMPVEDLKWERVRFERIYDEMRGRAVDEQSRCPQAVAMLAVSGPRQLTGPEEDTP